MSHGYFLCFLFLFILKNSEKYPPLIKTEEQRCLCLAEEQRHGDHTLHTMYSYTACHKQLQLSKRWTCHENMLFIQMFLFKFNFSPGGGYGSDDDFK